MGYSHQELADALGKPSARRPLARRRSGRSCGWFQGLTGITARPIAHGARHTLVETLAATNPDNGQFSFHDLLESLQPIAP